MKSKQINYNEEIIDAALDEVMHTSFITYAEYVTMGVPYRAWRMALSLFNGAFCIRCMISASCRISPKKIGKDRRRSAG